MDTGLAILVSEGLKISLSLYLATMRMQGKTEEEINAMLDQELKKAIAFNPKTDIKDV